MSSKYRSLSFRLGFLLLCSAFCAFKTSADVDADGDGVMNLEELAAGTDPANSQSVPRRALGSWRFTDGTFAGDDGQQPIAQSNVSTISNGFDGPGIRVVPGGVVSLKYRAIEPSGRPNISAVRGSILFRIKPNWSTGSGPGSTVTVLQTTNFAVRINSTGSKLMLTSTSSGTTITNAEVSIDVGSFGSFWSYGLVTYSPEQSSVSFDTPSSVVTGPGIVPPANLNDPNNFLAIGSAADGTGAVNALMDEVVAFNAPGALGLTPTSISAIASNNPAGLNLVWPSATNALMEVKRRAVGASTWEKTRAAVGTNFFDATVAAGQRYEYNLNTRIADLNTGLPDDTGQFLKAALNGTPLHSQGKIILLVDKTLTNAIEPELRGFITNLVGDGWQVLRTDVPRHVDDFSSPAAFYTNYFLMTNAITPFIRSNYAVFGPQIKYILAIGHVPVAYTGTTADDGHTIADAFHGSHIGAWASDLFYGDTDGNWTDVLNVPGSSYAFNMNTPGDGRLDQNKIPDNASGVAKIEMPVARIDLSFMPSFAASEAELLKRYFRKDAEFRKGIENYPAEAMAAEFLAIPSAMPVDLAREMVSKASVLKQPIVGDVFTDPRRFLFGIQSGPGFFDRINDSTPNFEHTTANIAAGQLRTNCAFYFLRGSYFPDWNTEDNFLRAPLAMTNGGLISAAFLGVNKGWRVNGLAVGYPVGNEMAEVINTWAVPGNAQSVRSMELMGDPTLRFPVLAPPGALSWKVTNTAVSLKWFGAPAASGYFVYRSTNGIMGDFQLISASPITGTNYTDSAVSPGSLIYMIRGFSTAVTGGASYTNLSQGVFSTPITSADPSTCCIGAQTIPEDSSLGATPFSIGEAGSESGLTFAAQSSNPTLLDPNNVIVNGVGPNRVIFATPTANQFGSTIITITAQTALSTVVRFFTLTVTPVNDPPSFIKGPDISVTQGSGTQVLAGWASGISPGPPNESTQALIFVVTNDSPHLFSGQPTVTASGALTFTPAPVQRGTALVSVQLKDDGGTADSGADTSYLQTFNLTVGFNQDTDGDGLPDDFEQLYGFDPNVAGDDAGDWDGDGMTNLQELAAGTDPKNSRSSVRINSAASQSPTFALEFNTVAGRNYSLDANDAFPNGPWETLATPIPGTGAPVQQLDPTAGNSSRRIYRISSTSPEGQDLTTEYAGLLRLTLLGNSDTLVSLPFLRPAAELGAVVAVNGSEVQLRGAPAWQANQWAYAGAGQSNIYFLLIRSGAAEGATYTIAANTSDTLTLDLQGDSLGNLHPGDAVAITPYWTLGTVFPGGDGVFASANPGSRASEVLFPNLSGNGINLAASATYYYWNGAWRVIGQGGTVKNDDVILQDMYFIVRHNVGTNTTLTTEGAVLTGASRSGIRRNAANKQDNFLSLARPLPVSLNDSGLVNLLNPDSGAFRPSPLPGNRLDELLTFDNSVPAINKAASATYYFWNGAWRKVGFGGADRGGDTVFQPGTGVVIRSGAGNADTAWTNSPTY